MKCTGINWEWLEGRGGASWGWVGLGCEGVAGVGREHLRRARWVRIEFSGGRRLSESEEEVGDEGDGARQQEEDANRLNADGEGVVWEDGLQVVGGGEKLCDQVCLLEGEIGAGGSLGGGGGGGGSSGVSCGRLLERRYQQEEAEES